MFERTRPVLLALLLTAAGAAAAAEAQAPGRIGLVDTRRLITQSEDGRQILTRLDKLAEEKAGRMKPLQDEIQALQKRIAEGRVSLSEDRIAQMERQLEERMTAARRLREDLQEEMEEAQTQAFGSSKVGLRH
jgi:Skp family chaperone for outer membrane proteins